MFECLKESSIVFLDIMFGIFINYIRIKRASPKISSAASNLHEKVFLLAKLSKLLHLD
ncbi:hypothetical protein SLEP1_g53753 [Rubroshorea leprosula]|uniref:Uncharacterized protein n=1 Tax=Rubroshorea leprosula TaxID=152421 RepID=A0AAV5MB66_9ROSI|nr:hypothetical protein SLEP1_g53753 [Rubroshorea leprosula]